MRPCRIFRENHDACYFSCDQIRNHLGRNDSRQFLFQPLELEREPFMVHPEEPQHGSIEIPHVHGIFYHVIAKIVGLAVNMPSLGSATRHPGGKAARMMVATVVVLGKAALAVDGPAEFSAPDDQSVL